MKIDISCLFFIKFDQILTFQLKKIENKSILIKNWLKDLCGVLELSKLIREEGKQPNIFAFFQCDQCDQSFRQRQLLRRHQNLYHNPTYVPPMPKVSNRKSS